MLFVRKCACYSMLAYVSVSYCLTLVVWGEISNLACLQVQYLRVRNGLKFVHRDQPIILIILPIMLCSKSPPIILFIAQYLQVL